MDEIPEKGVLLDGSELEHMRELLQAAERNLREIGKLTLEKIPRESKEPHSNLQEARFIFDNARLIFMTKGGSCGVYRDPPGICEPCCW